MSSSPPLPPGWTSAIDPSSGKMYYANPTTGESSWTPPSLGPTPPIQPPPSFPQQLTQGSTGMQGVQQQQQYATSQPHQGTQQHQSTQNSTSIKVSAASSVSALASSGLLVPAARAVVDSNTVVEGSDKDSERKQLELHGLSAGQIADLCALQREELAEKGVDFKPYTPITPYALNNTAKRLPMEPGRFEIRLHSLYNQLRKIQE